MKSMSPVAGKERLGIRLRKDMKINRVAYILAIPIVAYFVIFKYIPMYGVVMAFQDFSPGLGFMGSPFVGMKHFTDFFSAYNFWEIIGNTFLLSFYDLLWSFPAPILFALLINEVRHTGFKRSIQTLTYIPYFISLVVICGLLKDFSRTDGIFNFLVTVLGGEASNLLTRPELFRTIYISSGIWQSFGWGSIIYLAALSGIDTQLYEAAELDGAGKLRQAVHVSIPGIIPTIVILLIMRVGNILNIGFEKILLLQNGLNTQTSEVIATYVYKMGLLDADYGYGAAVGLFNTLISLVLLIAANQISKKLTENSLW